MLNEENLSAAGRAVPPNQRSTRAMLTQSSETSPTIGEYIDAWIAESYRDTTDRTWRYQGTDWSLHGFPRPGSWLWTHIAVDPSDPRHWILKSFDATAETFDAGATWALITETGSSTR